MGSSTAPYSCKSPAWIGQKVAGMERSRRVRSFAYAQDDKGECRMTMSGQFVSTCPMS